MVEAVHAAEQAVEAMAPVVSSLPALAVAFPLVGGVILAWPGNRNERLRNLVGVLACLGSLVCIALLLPITSRGGIVTYQLGVGAITTPLRFRVDGFALLFALVTSGVWTLAAIYSIKYMDHEHARTRFWIFLVLTLGADLGVLLAGDFLNLFVFFELLAVFSYVLVAHEETTESKDAGIRYMAVGIIGGLSLLAGIVLLKTLAGGLDIAPHGQALERLGAVKYWIAALMIIGFGAKAGMFPIHIWLPRAHPVAPSPASALLSGIMVKAGIYGIIRTGLLVFNSGHAAAEHALGLVAIGAGHSAEPIAHGTEAVAHAAAHAAHLTAAQNIGLVIIAIAAVTMVLGWVLALLQDNLKRLLAYSTISQIGYILMGVGCAGYLGSDGAMGLSGALYHVINHALYKATLFLMAGVILYKFGELSMKKLGGLGRSMPILTILTGIAVLGIMGVPLFNGYTSKTLLHHAIVESYEHHHLVWLHWIEIAFTITGGGTAAYYLKMIHRTFLGKPDPELKQTGDVPAVMAIPMAVLCALMLLIAWVPHLALNKLVLPGIQGHGFDAEFIHHHLHGIPFFTVANVVGIAKSLAIGIGIYFAALVTGFLDWKAPAWMSIEGIYELASKGFIWLCRGPVTVADRLILQVYNGVAAGFVSFCKTLPVMMDAWIYKTVASAIPFMESGWLFGLDWDPACKPKADPGVEACRRTGSIHTGRLNTYLGWIIIAFVILLGFFVIRP